MTSVPRGRPKTFDKMAALDATVGILWREGASNVSLNDLAVQLGTPKPNLARAFGTKDELTAHALRRYNERFGWRVEKALSDDGTLEEIVSRYLAVLVQAHTGETTPPGCLFNSAWSDFTQVKEGPVRQALNAINLTNFKALRDRLAEAGSEMPEALARFLMAQNMAMSIMARNGADRAALQSFADIAIRAVA